MGDFCDGLAYKESPLFQQDRTALQIQLYYDDVEAVNPLGSNTKVHKLGMQLLVIIRYTRHVHALQYCWHSGLFYYTLGNLDPKLRSTLDSIFLLAIAKVTAIQAHGIDVILEPFVEAVQKLEVRG